MWNTSIIRMMVALLIFLSMTCTTIQGDESSYDDDNMDTATAMTEPSPDTSATTTTTATAPPIATARREAAAKRRAEAAEALRQRRRKMMAAAATASSMMMTTTTSSAASAAEAARRQVQSAQKAASQQQQQKEGRKGRRHRAIHEARKMAKKNGNQDDGGVTSSGNSGSSSTLTNTDDKEEQESQKDEEEELLSATTATSSTEEEQESSDYDEGMEEETAVADAAESASTSDAAAAASTDDADDDVDEEKGEIDNSEDMAEESMTADDSIEEQPSADFYKQPTLDDVDSDERDDADDDYNSDNEDDDDDDMEKYLADFDTMLKEHDESMESLLVTSREKMEQQQQLLNTLSADYATLEKVTSEVVQQIHKVNVRQLEELRNALKEIYNAESSRRQRITQTISTTTATATSMDSSAISENMMTVEELEPILSDTLLKVVKQRDEDLENIIVDIIRDKANGLDFPDFEKLERNDDNEGGEYEVGSSSVSNNCVAPVEAVETIHQTLVNFSNDFIGRHDHVVTDFTMPALLTSSSRGSGSGISSSTVPHRRRHGGRIVHEMTSSTYIADITSPQQYPQQSQALLGESWWRQLIPEDWEAFLLPVGWERWDTRMPLWLAHTLRLGGGYSGAAATAAAPPESILQSQILPGACWPMSGATGHVTVALPYNLHVDGISIDHASRALLDKHDEQVKSAPKRVRVIGYPPCWDGDMKDEDDDGGTSCRGLSFNPHDPLHIMDLEYDIHKAITQTFDIKLNEELADKTTCTADEEEGSCSARPEVSASPLEKDDVIAAVRFEVLENWGNPEYTCLYRVRVHGKRAEVEG